MIAPQDYTGGVYDPSLEDGRAVAVVEIGVDGVEARTERGGKFRVPFAGMTLELGGTGGAVVFCHGAECKTTIYTADKAFVTALAQCLHTETSEKAQRLLGQKRRKRWTGRGVTWVIVLILAVLAAVTPTVLGWAIEKTVATLPTTWDENLGSAVMEQVRSQTVPVTAPEVEGTLQIVLARLKEHVPEGYDEWKFRVWIARDSTVNAFALPGGNMVFHSGLLERAESIDEVAGVMAHEMAHVLERHSMQRIAQSVGIVAGLGLLLGDTGVLAGATAEFATQAAINQYSRADEAEADRIAVEIMHRAGLDPLALSAMFERMEKDEQGLPDALHWISTHPSHAARVRAIRAQVDALPAVESQPLDVDWESVKQALAR